MKEEIKQPKMREQLDLSRGQVYCASELRRAGLRVTKLNTPLSGTDNYLVFDENRKYHATRINGEDDNPNLRIIDNGSKLHRIVKYSSRPHRHK